MLDDEDLCSTTLNQSGAVKEAQAGIINHQWLESHRDQLIVAEGQ